MLFKFSIFIHFSFVREIPTKCVDVLGSIALEKVCERPPNRSIAYGDGHGKGKGSTFGKEYTEMN